MNFKTKLVFEENFSKDLEDWWVEGDLKVWVNDNKIFVESDKPGQNSGASGTVWCKKKNPKNFMVTYKACVLQSSLGANNINLFFCYNHPSDNDLFETKEERATGAYALYHDLNGYIITYLNDYSADAGCYEDGSTKARIRMRRCPGFQLVNEDYTYHCHQNRVYDFKLIKHNNKISFFVDGEVRLEWNDTNEPWGEGSIGLRTFQSNLYWEDIKIFEIIE